MTYETCTECGCETGKAGRGEDSLYSEYDDSGPYCGDCFDVHEEKCRTASEQFGAGS